MTDQTEPGSTLARVLDQTHALLQEITPDQLDQPSTCDGWTVRDLVRHVVASPSTFVRMLSGEEVDWANAPELGDDPAADFRAGADDLLAFVAADGTGAAAGAALPEFAVHSWDLARSIGSSAVLDDEAAEEALRFMRANLTPERRGEAFGPEVQANPAASVHDRLAAFAGRSPR